MLAPLKKLKVKSQVTQETVRRPRKFGTHNNLFARKNLQVTMADMSDQTLSSAIFTPAPAESKKELLSVPSTAISLESRPLITP